MMKTCGGNFLCIIDWMNWQGTKQDVKSSWFCLTSGCDDHLWYEWIVPVGNDWDHLQECFQWQVSKLGYSQEELFQRWRSFKFKEDTEPVDSNVPQLKQCEQKLVYNEGQVFEYFKNTGITIYFLAIIIYMKWLRVLSMSWPKKIGQTARKSQFNHLYGT